MAPTEGRAGGLSHISCRANWKNSIQNPELVSRLQEAVTGMNCKVQERKKLGVGGGADRLPMVTWAKGFAPPSSDFRKSCKGRKGPEEQKPTIFSETWRRL